MSTEFSDGYDSAEESNDDMQIDSDEALQTALAEGKLKPGLVVLQNNSKQTNRKQKFIVNNVEKLKAILNKISLPKSFGWVERMDIVNSVAALAPEIAVQLDEHKTKREREIQNRNRLKKLKGKGKKLAVEDDPVHNDFVREMQFYRQAQEAVLKSIPRLKEMGIPTKRPDDYFAEMAKSDSQMQKVAQVLLKKQTAAERSEKARKLREAKKFAKQTQIQVIQERQKAKKEMIESVKKLRKGQQKNNNLEFLDQKKTLNRRDKGKVVNKRRQSKNEKYGYGGKKRGQKRNTRDSLDNFDDGGSGGRKGNRKGMNPRFNKNKGKISKRPGKITRQKNKSKR